jgi:hypothetical protein|tara:strand:- start:197 stop:463 length:267 start_codon:yes stop_codon:yes gene_type:complete
MRLASMNQLAITVKESLKTLAVDNYTVNNKKASSIQSRYVDSVELSDRAIELSMQVDTETDQGQEGNVGTNQLQKPVLTGAVSLNVFA